ncbi:MAG: hypothetical protein LH469_00770 [Frankiaceae bacterium]|nr:hypothetical protein [Frankiaceae bacterium]
MAPPCLAAYPPRQGRRSCEIGAPAARAHATRIAAAFVRLAEPPTPRPELPVTSLARAVQGPRA